jgi:hypothetical protein
LYIQEIGRQMESDREERRHRQESNCAVTFGCGSVESEFYSKHGREPYEILRKRSIGFVFLSYNFTFFFCFSDSYLFFGMQVKSVNKYYH